jgi:hypothetical protein
MRYIKLREHGPKSKEPVEKWRLEENQYGLHELREWISSGHNYGVVCGIGGLGVLDVDAPRRVDELGVRPFETYAVKTGSGGYHLYYKIIGEGKKVIMHDFEGTHLGELQFEGQYVVGAGSIHPNGTEYRVVNPDTPILEITQEELLLPFRGRCKLSDEVQKTARPFVNLREDLTRMSLADLELKTSGTRMLHPSQTASFYAAIPHMDRLQAIICSYIRAKMYGNADDVCLEEALRSR